MFCVVCSVVILDKTLLISPTLQAKVEPPKGLAASRFANLPDSADDEGASGETAEAEGEAEPDHSSSALASVRATLALKCSILYSPPFLSPGPMLIRAG